MNRNRQSPRVRASVSAVFVTSMHGIVMLNASFDSTAGVSCGSLSIFTMTMTRPQMRPSLNVACAVRRSSGIEMKLDKAGMALHTATWVAWTCGTRRICGEICAGRAFRC